MKVAFLCPSISRTSGGIFEIARRLAQCLAQTPGVVLEVFSTTDQFSGEDAPAWEPLQPRVFPYIGPGSFRYSRGLRRAFLTVPADIAHSHALWMYNSILVQQWSAKRKAPYLVTINGMLEPWALRNSRWKKRFASVLYERACLMRAACLQVNSQNEQASVRAFGLRNPVCVIPNGIDLPALAGPDPEPGNQACSPSISPSQPFSLSAFEKGGRKVLLFLSRIHPKKGLVNLLRAWSKLQVSTSAFQPTKDWLLVIAGWDQGGHEAELKQLATELNLKWTDTRQLSVVESDALASNFSFQLSAFQDLSLVFTGPLFGEAKVAAYRACDAFILPSFSEGLPMAVLEAWAYGKPVLMTPECNLPEGFAAAAALRIDPTLESIGEGLRMLLAAPSGDLAAMGARGRALVEERFAWPKIAGEMKQVYEWVLGGGAKPGCVSLE